MRKLTSIILGSLIFALSHMSFTTKSILTTGAALVTSKLNSQNVAPYADNVNHQYVWIVTNSPGNDPSTAINIMKMNKTTMWFHQDTIYYTNLLSHSDVAGGSNKMLSIAPNGSLCATSFSSIAFPYSQLTGTPTIPSQGTLTALTASTGISIINGSVITNSIPDKTVSITGDNNLTVSSSYPNFTVSLPARTSNTVSRSLMTGTTNVSYSISATYDYNVNYSVFAMVTSALAGTNTADVYLEISPDNSSWNTIARSGISLSGIVSTSGNTQTVSGYVPKSYYVRIRADATGSNSGSAVFTYQVGQENTY